MKNLRFTGILPWLIIIIFGTASFARVEQIQTEQKHDQVLLAVHENALLQQLRVNEGFRLQWSAKITHAILNQCIQEYRLDGKLDRLAIGVYSVSKLDSKVKLALKAFAREIEQNKGELQCADPLPKKLRQKLTLPSSTKITLRS
jgi:putative ubiquitin-RnfH superfamily antitoxin RatB of RatAB toxin-antitoxin module